MSTSQFGFQHMQIDDFPSNTFLSTPLSILFTTLTSLVHPATPFWLQPHLSTARASLPLRVDGVRQTILFIARSMPQANLQTSASVPVDGPAFSLEVLNQVSRVLCSVPSIISMDDYFLAISPQLLALLDGDDQDMQRAASFVIGFGILGRRNTGAPGTIGWKLFVEPLINTIKLDKKAGGPAHETVELLDLETLLNPHVPSAELHRAINRLSALILIHPNPGLTKRLLGPLLLCIWGMTCLAKEERVALSWVEQCVNLILTYLKICEGAKGFIRLVDEILWDGGHDWEYVLETTGEPSIRRRHDSSLPPIDADKLISKIELRLALYEQLLDNGAINDIEMGIIFIHIAEHWLGKQSTRTERLKPIIETDRIEDPISSLIYAKAAQGMLWKYKSVVAKQPNKILLMVKQLLEGFTSDISHSHEKQRESKTSVLSIADLESIVSRQSNNNTDASSVMTEDEGDIISACLSILSIVLSSTDSTVSIETSSLLNSLQPTLSKLGLPRSYLPYSTQLTARNISALITIHTSRKLTSQTSTSPAFDRHLEDRETHSLAMANIGDSLPPVRSQGLSLLDQLIKTSSPVLDIPSTCILLISMLQDEEEFIYLSAIRSLEFLSSRHSKTVMKALLEQYVDHEEEVVLDQRLKIGEALLKTVEGLGTALTGDVAKMVSEGVIAVAGRRGKRSKGLTQKQESTAKDLASKQEAENAWGGEVPKFDEDDNGDDDENENQVSERLAKVLETWEGKDGEEDIRIRTSALSILGVAIETNIAGMGSVTTSTAIDLAISILQLEIVPAKVILRRAAVHIVMSMVKALDKAQEEGQQLGFGLAGESLKEVLKVLRYVEATDADDVVRGHVREVIESLGVWQSKSLLGIGRGYVQPNLGVNGRLAGLSMNMEAATLSPPRIEEVE